MEIHTDLSESVPPVDLDRSKNISAQSATLHITPWDEAVVDRIGLDPRSLYVETFWLPVLGPSATWLLRRLADELDVEPEGFELDLDATAVRLGLGVFDSRHSPLRRALDRYLRYGIARRAGGGGLAVRRHVPTVPRRQLLRLPTAVQEQHRAWETAASEPGETVRLRRRARLVALDLRDLGVDDACIERHLLRRGVHPAMAFEAARWAWSPEGVDDRPYVLAGI